MKKIFSLICMLCLYCFSVHAAPLIGANPTIAVMDFGTHQGAATLDVELANAEGTSAEYILARLVEDGRYDVKDVDFVKQTLHEQGIKTVGIIDPRQAKQIGELLGVRYIVYGNVNDVSASQTGTNAVLPVQQIAGSVTVHTVKAHIIARVMDVNTGFIIAAVKGEGLSRSSYTDISALKAAIKLGTETVTQESVHNAIQKAAFATADILSSKLFGTAIVNKKGKKK